jgi:hypothetical protein
MINMWLCVKLVCVWLCGTAPLAEWLRHWQKQVQSHVTQRAWVQFPPYPAHETCLLCAAMSGVKKLACLWLLSKNLIYVPYIFPIYTCWKFNVHDLLWGIFCFGIRVTFISMDGVENGKHKERVLLKGPRQLSQYRFLNIATAAIRTITEKIFIAKFISFFRNYGWQYNNNTNADC